MKIGVIAASSQREKVGLLCRLTREAAPQAEVIDFGCFADEADVSYIEIAVEAGLLLTSGAVDFIVTGCSSGQGMMLACNAMPGVLCGYLPTPQDAFLFGRINGGNAASLPLGLGFGWAGEINLRHTLMALFDGEMGCGYPPEDAERKKRDTLALKALKASSNVEMNNCLSRMDPCLRARALSRKSITEYIRTHGTNRTLVRAIMDCEA